MHSSVFILIFGEDCLKFIELEVSHKPKTNSRDVSSVVTATVTELIGINTCSFKLDDKYLIRRFVV